MRHRGKGSNEQQQRAERAHQSKQAAPLKQPTKSKHKNQPHKSQNGLERSEEEEEEGDVKSKVSKEVA